MQETLTKLSHADLPLDLDDVELIPANDPRSTFLSLNPARLGGRVCFTGTRVPVKALWDYLAHDATLAEFLDDFEGVPREEALAALRYTLGKLTDGLPGEHRT